MSAPDPRAAAPPAAVATTAVPCGVDPVHVVTGEAHLVLAAMRLNKRWAADVLAPDPSAALAPETQLLSAFFTLLETLSDTVASAGGMANVDPMAYLRPFLDVIQAESTSGPITGVALSAVHKILLHVLSPASPGLPSAMREIARALANCRFEATDPEADQSTLARLLHVLVACVQVPPGTLMPDDALCDLYDTVFRLAVPQRSRSVSSLLRSLAEQSIVEFARAVFRHFGALRTVADSTAATASAPYGQAALLRILKSAACALHPNASQSAQIVPASPLPIHQSASAPVSAASSPQPRALVVAPAMAQPQGQIAPGLPPAPANPKTKAEAQYVALNVVNAVVEVCGAAMPASPEFAALISTDLCCALLQLLQTPHTSILAVALRALLNLFATCRPLLKLHVEAFVVAASKLVLSADAQQPRNVELLLQTLCELCHDTHFAVELYANYDCDLYCTNALKVLSEALYKAAFPRGGALADSHVIALDGLLALLASLWRCVARADATPSPASPAQSSEPKRLRLAKQNKTTLAQCVEKFNASPKEGLKLLQQCRLLPDPLDPSSVAAFLKNAPGLNKQVVGDYISSRHEFNNNTLKEYIRLFNLVDHKFIESFREFMQSYKTPGDANLISRILEAYGQEYVNTARNGVYENADACYVNSYSVVLLNVDLHNSEVKEKMTLEQYINNNRGINNGKDFPREYLSDIYFDIKNTPLTIPEEVPSGSMTQKACEDMLRRAPRVARYVSAAPLSGKGALDLYRDVFATLWNPLIAALSVCFESAVEERTIHRVLRGFSLCGQLAARYQLTEVIDYLVVYLCKSTALPFSVPVENPVLSFGANLKAHIAAEAMFALARGHASFLRESWVNVLDIASALHDMELVPDVPGLPDFTLTEAPAAADSRKEKRKSHGHEHGGAGQKSGSWLGALLWGSSAGREDEEDARTPEEAEAAERANRCAEACRVYELVEQSRAMDEHALQCLLKAVVHCSLAHSARSDAEESALWYLDVLVQLALINAHRSACVWPTAFEHLSRALNAAAEAAQATPFAERATVGLLILCIHLAGRPEHLGDLTAALYAVSRLPAPVLDDLADVVAMGAAALAKSPACKAFADAGALNAVLALVESVAAHRDGYAKGFEALRCVVAAGVVASPEEHKICTHALASFLKSPVRADAAAAQAVEMLGELFGRAHAVAVKHVVTRSPAATAHADAALLTWELFSHVMSSLSDMSRDPVPEVRHNAMTVLQRVLLSRALEELSQPLAAAGESAGQPMGWAIARSVRVVVFPLLSALLHPFGSTKDEADETRLRACTLLSKMFLQHLPTLSQHPEFTMLWADVLGFFEQYMALAKGPSSSADLLVEALPESMKNMLLVMTAIGVFETVTPRGRELWELTCRALDRFCPGMREDILSKLVPPPQPSAATAAPASPVVAAPAAAPTAAPIAAASTALAGIAEQSAPLSASKVVTI
eukprot:m51a1_g7185 Golgi brefeldin A resistant guanine nucleotide exchange factor 1 (1460) ;mRNA; f:91629-97104